MGKRVFVMLGIVLMVLFSVKNLHAQIVIYVDSSAAGLNNGQSWLNAYTSLDSALLSAKNLGNVDTIKLAKGTYFPSLVPSGTVSGDARDVSFHVSFSGVIRGGYAPGGSALNHKQYKTLLSGDIGAAFDSLDNAYHVIVATSGTARIYGVTITSGNANGADSLQTGLKKIARSSAGGVYISGANLTLQETIIERNFAGYGGGIYNHASTVSILNTVFYVNRAFRGGALYNSKSSTTTMDNCVAFANSAEDAGGAIVNDDDAQYLIRHSSFVGNYVDNFLSGGIYNIKNRATSKITNTLFSGNYILGDPSLADWGGSDFFDSSNASSLSYCVVQTQTTGSTIFYTPDAGLRNPSNPMGPDNIWATADDGLSITPGSQAFKTGGAGNIAFDITNASRNVTAFDIGAYEITPCGQVSGRTIYVDSSAAGNGTGASWADPLKDLQSAINLARLGCVDTIKMAAGTYRPTNYLRNGSGNYMGQGLCFQLPSNIAILGGYAPGGSSQASPAAHKTYLTNNRGRVIFAGNAAGILLDGLHIKNGSTYGVVGESFTVNGVSYPSSRGGGIMLHNTDATIRRTTLENNRAGDHGAGMSVYNGKIIIDSCIFERNETAWQGAGLFIDLPKAGSLINASLFRNNAVNYFGGGIFLIHATAGFLISNSRFTSNKTRYTGGDVIGGGAICSEAGTNLTITKCVFDSNAGDFGGALRLEINSINRITNSFFLNNTTNKNGGAVYSRGYSLFYNTVFSGNSAPLHGGAMYATWHTDVYFSTFVRNQAATTGGGCSGTSITLRNSIFWRNSIAGNITAPTADINGCPSGSTSLQVTPASPSARNISGVEPLFVNDASLSGADSILGTADDGLRLKLQSPFINEGQEYYDSLNYITDMTGAPRRNSIYPDMGAYESDFCGESGFVNRTIYVDSSATSGARTGANWANAYTDLETALRAFRFSCGADTIKIAKGTYIPTAMPRYSPHHANTKNENTFAMPSNIVILGGYPTGGGTRDFRSNRTIFSGFSKTPLYQSRHVVFINGKTGVLIDGVIVQEGFSTSAGYDYIDETAIIPRAGAGFYITNSTVNIQNTVIRNTNQGIYLTESYGRFLNCIVDSIKSSDWSAVNSRYSPVEFINCIFSKNVNSGFGGAFYTSTNEGVPSFRNCTFYGNSASLGGALCVGRLPYISNCLFWNNRARSVSHPSQFSEHEITTSHPSDSLHISNSLFQYKPYNYSGKNSFYGLQPLLTDSAKGVGPDRIWGTADDGLRPLSNSPAINRGRNDSLPAGIAGDISGAVRIMNGTVDIGAYEVDGSLQLCPPAGSASLSAGITGSNYQWQLSTDSVNFINLSDNANYSGTNTSVLQLIAIPSSFYGNQYRCDVNGVKSPVFTIKFSNTWTGATDALWNNPLNWSCGTVPDENTEVVISNGNVLLNSNVTIRSLKIATGVTLTVAAGYALTITH